MLKVYLTDLIGNTVAKVRRIPAKGGGNQTKVTVPLCDSRTASTRGSLFDDTLMAQIRPLSRMLKVYYQPPGHTSKLIFWGVLLKPSYDLDAGTVTLNAHDQSIWAKKNFHRYGDIVVDTGYTVDGRGVRDLWTSAIPLDTQIARGVRHPGVLWGYDNTTRLPYPADPKNPASGEAYVAYAERGQNVKDSIDALSDQEDGPEWNLHPLDLNDPGTVAARGTTGYPRISRGDRPAQLGQSAWVAQLDTYVAALKCGKSVSVSEMGQARTR